MMQMKSEINLIELEIWNELMIWHWPTENGEC